jgi:hypothetical protein
MLGEHEKLWEKVREDEKLWKMVGKHEKLWEMGESLRGGMRNNGRW